MGNWYEYRQNHSGGSFDKNDEVTITVLIEEVDATTANYQAEDVGIYFDGVSNGCDCDCCGDRWYEADEPVKFVHYMWNGRDYDRHEYATVEEYAEAKAEEVCDDIDAKLSEGEAAVILYYQNGNKKVYRKE